MARDDTGGGVGTEGRRKEGPTEDEGTERASWRPSTDPGAGKVVQHRAPSVPRPAGRAI